MTEYGAPITTSETYCRDRPVKQLPQLCKPALQRLLRKPAGTGQPGCSLRPLQYGTETALVGPSRPPPTALGRWPPQPAHSPGRPAH